MRFSKLVWLTLVACVVSGFSNPRPAEKLQVIARSGYSFLVHLDHQPQPGERYFHALMTLCDEAEAAECEVYGWINRAKIPSGFPLRNTNLPYSLYFYRNSEGRMIYRCLVC